MAGTVKREKGGDQKDHFHPGRTMRSNRREKNQPYRTAWCIEGIWRAKERQGKEQEIKNPELLDGSRSKDVVTIEP